MESKVEFEINRVGKHTQLRYVACDTWVVQEDTDFLYLTKKLWSPHEPFRLCYSAEKGHSVDVAETIHVEICDVRIIATPRKAGE